MITLNSFATARSLLQRLKSYSSKLDLYEDKYDSVVSFFEIWLITSDADEVAIDELECDIQNNIRELEEALFPLAVETNNITAEIIISPTAATDDESDSSLPPTENPSSDPSSSPEQVDSPFNSGKDELPELPDWILASYERLCPGSLSRDDDELNKEAADSDADANAETNTRSNTETNAGSNSVEPVKQRKKGGGKWIGQKKSMKGI